jgi:hypothetical protein
MMSEFMHKLAEALRVREQYLEDHSEHPVFESESGGGFKRSYDLLVSEIKAFSDLIEKFAATGEEFDEHFERKINDENEQLSVKIDAWSKTLGKEYDLIDSLKHHNPKI